MDKIMKAGVLYAIEDIRCSEVPVPTCKDDEVLVNVTAAGICGTDFERVLKTGTWTFPTTLGHEFGGIVEQVGNQVDSGLKVGDKVVVNPMVPCYECKYCKLGEFNMCESYQYVGSRIDGGFADYVSVQHKNVYKVPDDFSPEAVASIDPIAVALHGVVKGQMKIGDSVAVFGSGPIGHYAVQWAKLMGASKVIAIDIVDEKLKIAEKVGADYCINALKEDPVAKIKEITGQEGVSLAIESAGSDKTVVQCLESVRKKGRVVYLGTPHRDVMMPDKAFESILRKEIQVTGSWCYHFDEPIHEWMVSIDYVKKGLIDYESVITHKFVLDDVASAFDMIKQRKEFFNKIIIFPREV